LQCVPLGRSSERSEERISRRGNVFTPRLIGFVKRVTDTVYAAFDAGRDAVDWHSMNAAILMTDHEKALSLMRVGQVATTAALQDSQLEELLADVLQLGGDIAADELVDSLRASAGPKKKKAAPVAAPTGEVVAKVTFDIKNVAAEAWLRKHVAELIKTLADTTLDDVRETIVQSFEAQMPLKEMANELAASLGDRKRARLIARTETMMAANEGQKQMWQQAKNKGLIEDWQKITWIVTPDEKLCSVCEPYDGTQVAVGEEFDEGGPPLHPNCRCTVGLI